MSKWTERFMDLATRVAGWSKDPSTKVGAVAVSGSKQVLETGYNGLPRGVRDVPERMERPAKYMWTAHAEENLVAHAARGRLEGATIYVTHMCCASCTRMLINAGVGKIIVGPGTTSMPADQFEVAKTMLKEAGVAVYYEDDAIGG
jgi:dCMP deaminase